MHRNVTWRETVYDAKGDVKLEMEMSKSAYVTERERIGVWTNVARGRRREQVADREIGGTGSKCNAARFMEKKRDGEKWKKQEKKVACVCRSLTRLSRRFFFYSFFIRRQWRTLFILASEDVLIALLQNCLEGGLMDIKIVGRMQV